MRAVIYTRVSKDKRNRASVEQQEDEARLAAAALGWTISRVFVDNDVSASRHSRKAREDHAALVEFIRAGGVDVLILWESSRGDRTLTTWSGLLDLCRDLGVKIHVVDHRRTYDLTVPRDWKTLADEGVNNAYSSEETRERILRDVRAQATKGRPHGRLLYGYRRVYDDAGHYVEQVEHPEQAAVVREAARRFRAGETLYAIAQDFQARGIPTPRPGMGWRPEQIPRLVNNPGYIAQRVHQGKVIGPADWPAILDESTYADCVARLNDPGRRTVRDNRAKHLLTGVSFCAHCDSRMFVQKAPRTQQGTVLTCRGGFCAAAKEGPVTEFVTAMVIARLSKPDFLELYAAPMQNSAGSAQGEAAELRARLNGFYESAATGGISPEGLAAIEARLLPQIEEAQRRALVVPVPAVLRDAAGPHAAQAWERLDLDQRRLVVRLLVEVRISRAGRGTRYFSHERLRESRWVGDVRTWGQIWAEASAGELS